MASKRIYPARASSKTSKHICWGASVEINSDGYLQARLALLQEKLHQVDRLAGQGELPDAEITGELLKVSPLKKAVPEEAEQLERKPSPSCPT
jgi:hypothetical protein